MIFSFLKWVFSCFDRCLAGKITKKSMGQVILSFGLNVEGEKVIGSGGRPSHALSTL